jgi:hypothetical protein
MGGAGKHMIHPYQCPEVKNGQDLVAFYIRAVQSIENDPPSIKLDGVNVSFRLKQITSYPGFEFVVDRGSKTVPIDFEGITAANAHERFVSKNPEVPHGMIKATETLTTILNSDRENLKPHLEELGVFDRMGPYGIFFNAEFYSDKDGDGVGNVTKYNKNFIAIHGLSEFYEDNRGTREVRSIYKELEDQINDLKEEIQEADVNGEDLSELQEELKFAIQEYYNKKNNHKKILNDISKELQDNANKVDFHSFSTIPVKFGTDESVDKVIDKINEELDKEWTFLHKNFYLQNRNNEQFDGPMGIGPGKMNTETGDFSGRTLREHLENVKINPEHKDPDVRVSNYYFREILKKERNPKNDAERTRYAFSQDIYEAVAENDVGIADIAYQNEDISTINDAVVLWHAVRVLGNVVKQSLTSDVDLGLSIYEQEGIVLQSPGTCNGVSFKLTGEFFLDNRNKDPGEKKHKVGEMLHEVKLYEQEGDKKQYVILIPGGFKPPTGGHYSMIKQYDENSDVIKVFVVTGRGGATERASVVSLEQSQQIFKVYGGFSDKVEFIEAQDPTPLTTCYKLMENPDFINQFPNAYFSIGAGDKGNDPQRIEEFVNYFINNKGLTDAKIRYHAPVRAHMVRGEPASASRMRKAYTGEDWELFKELLPHPDLYDDVVQILSGQAEGPINENFLLAVSRSFLVNEVESEKQRRFMCAQMNKPAAERPEGLSPSEAKEMCKSKVHEELGPGEEISGGQEMQLRNRISTMLANIMVRMPELSQSTPSQIASLAEPLLDTIVSQLTQVVAKETRSADVGKETEEIKNKMVSEMSAAAAGAVSGHANSAWDIGEDDEQKRKTSSRV